MADLTVPALLTTAVTGLAGTVAFLFYRLEQAREKLVTLKAECEKETKALHEAHKQELRENGKTTVQLLKDTIAACDRLCDLEEARRP